MLFGMSTATKPARPLSPVVVELLRKTPPQFAGVRRHIIAHGGLSKGLRRAILAGQFGRELREHMAGLG